MLISSNLSVVFSRLTGCSFLFVGSLLWAQEQPSSWGLGVGIAAGFYPHYPGSEETETLITPFPYPEYYGEKITLDSDGLIANLIESDRFNLDMSLNGSLPVSDQDNRARVGMDDLELVLEVGPALEITMAEWEGAELRLDLPIRSAFKITLDQAPKDVGFTFDPRLHYEKQYGRWEWDIDVGALFATERYHSLYYGVPVEFLTSDRTYFEANGGLTGWRVSSGAEYRWDDWSLQTYVRYLNFSSAENKDSPLLVEDDYLAAGVALIWFFRTSSKED